MSEVAGIYGDVAGTVDQEGYLVGWDAAWNFRHARSMDLMYEKLPSGISSIV